jgi:hypothetical protein
MGGAHLPGHIRGIGEMTISKFVAVVQRALLSLALLATGLMPSAVPASAQTAPTTINFSPTSVVAGQPIALSGSGFVCEASVTIELRDITATKHVADLGVVHPPCGSFPRCDTANPTCEVTIPSSTPAGQYRIRGTSTASANVFADSDGLLTVRTPGLTVSGTATCAGDFEGQFTLPSATVQLFSGSALVATTTADSQGNYTFNGLAAGAHYSVRYTEAVSEGTARVCGAVVVPNDGRGFDVSPPARCANQGWDNAAALTSGVLDNSATICKPNQSVWRKISVAPGELITLSVRGGSDKMRVALFRDLRQDFTTLLSRPITKDAEFARQFNASMSGPTSAPWNSSPWDSSPWNSSPWNSSPWNSSPWNSSPWNSSPWNSSPWNSSQLCAETGAIANFTVEDCAGAYSAVQMRGLLAFSTNGQISRNTWDLSGDFYIRVFNEDASFDPTQRLNILTTVQGTCGVPPQTGTAPAIARAVSSFLTPAGTSLPGGKSTLILTNTSRLRGSNGLPVTDVTNQAFSTTVNAFATRINGTVVDLASDAGLQKAFAQWDTPPFPSCAAAANAVSDGIHDLINAYRAQNPGLQYVTILGGHTVVPYRLIPDHAEIEIEKRYNPGLLDTSKSAATLASGYIMSDNYYVSLNPVSALESEISLPDANMAIGRLVEFSDDIVANLATFNANNGVMRPTAAIATGYTFVADLAQTELNLFTRGGVTDTDKLINDTWSAPELRSKLFDPARNPATGGANYDILALNWHARSNEAVAADYSTQHPSVLKSSDIANLPATDQRFSNVLVISIGCHLAHPLLNGDLIPNPSSPPQFVTDSRAFTETLQARGAMVLGNTGYGYGDTDFVDYGERLLVGVTQQLQSGTSGDGGVPVGLALTRAKRAYIHGMATLTGVDRKSVEELTFYGPPMWKVDFPTRNPVPGQNTIDQSPVVANPNSTLSSMVVSPPYSLVQKQLTADDITTTYFETAEGGKQQMPFRATLPFKSFDVSRPSAGTARGVALLSADYTDTPNTTSTTSLPATELSGARTRWLTPGFWPLQTFGLNQLESDALVVTPVQTQQLADGTLTTRTFPSSGATNLRVYYANPTGGALFAGPASLNDISISRGPQSNVHIDLAVGGANVADIFDVLVSYTAASGSLHSHWKTCSLMLNSLGQPITVDDATRTHSCQGVTSPINLDAGVAAFNRRYVGDIDALAEGAASASDLLLSFQVVTNTGLVTTRNNDGLYYSVESVTVGNPKASTAITVAAPVTPQTYDRSATYTATLSSTAAGCSVANRVLTFVLGSQSARARTDAAGRASVSYTVLNLPATYSLVVNFAETPTCLGATGLAANDVQVIKKNTSLTFGATPYLATLKDADGQVMRDEFVFFTVTGNGKTVTRSAQTDGLGVAQLRDLQLPAGAYTVTVSFPGTIPSATPPSPVQLDDERYNSSSVSAPLTVDRKAPSCALTGSGIDPVTQKGYIIVTVQDTGSGLASVNPTELHNAVLSIPPYAAGFTRALQVKAIKQDQSIGAQVALQVDDVAGNITNCDPIMVTVGRDKGIPSTYTTPIAPAEIYVTIVNGRPGVEDLNIKVNQRVFRIRDLEDGQTRTLNIASAMKKDNNVVTISARGADRGETALVIISDTPSTP